MVPIFKNIPFYLILASNRNCSDNGNLDMPKKAVKWFLSEKGECSWQKKEMIKVSYTQVAKFSDKNESSINHNVLLYDFFIISLLIIVFDFLLWLIRFMVRMSSLT